MVQLPSISCRVPKGITHDDALRSRREARQNLGPGLKGSAYDREAARILGLDYKTWRAAFTDTGKTGKVFSMSRTEVASSASKARVAAKTAPRVAKTPVSDVDIDFAIDDWLGGTAYAKSRAEIAKLSGVEAERASMHAIGAQGGPISKARQSSIDRIQQEIINNGTPSEVDLYRGMILGKNEDVAAIVRDLGPSSFGQLDSALAYADAMTGNFQQVILHVKAGTRALNIDEKGIVAWGEPESIVAGRFHITEQFYDRDNRVTVYELAVG